ncbi:hypothetical protein RI367_000323 [Sorochytrium milnesiophthora]
MGPPNRSGVQQQQKGCKPDAQRSKPHQKSPLADLFEAVLAGDAAAVCQLLESVRSAPTLAAPAPRSRKPSNSTGKVTSAGSIDPNAVWPGLWMTPLMLAVTLNHHRAVEALLDCALVDVNVRDAESGWTALHKALYLGNIGIVLLMLQKRGQDIDFRLTDHERQTAFDLYRLTVDGASPALRIGDIGDAAAAQSLSNEVYTWGVNTNVVLGHGHLDNSAHPKRVVLPGEDVVKDVMAGYRRTDVRALAMSKLHTVIVTQDGVFTCGFGNGGRLGHSSDTQLRPKLVNAVTSPIRSVAVGRDHTVALSEDGQVWVWGSNQFGQCGFPVPECDATVTLSCLQSRFSAYQSSSQVHASGGGGSSSSNSAGHGSESSTTLSPRILVNGPLKRESVFGVCASKFHTIVYNDKSLIAFGLNCGQLGHLQTLSTPSTFEVVAPRRATLLPPGRIQQVATTEWSTCVLLDGAESGSAAPLVIVVSNYAYRRVVLYAGPGENPSHVRHPQNVVRIAAGAGARNEIAKRSVGEKKRAMEAADKQVAQFALVTQVGDVFRWEVDASQRAHRGGLATSPRASANNKHSSSSKAHDVAIGTEGLLLVAVKSGHCYLGQPQKTSTSGYSFKQLPGLQRVTSVFANPSGAFAALRHDAMPEAVHFSSAKIQMAQDMATAIAHVVDVSDTIEHVLQRDRMEALREAQDADDDGADAQQRSTSPPVDGHALAADAKPTRHALQWMRALPSAVLVEKNRDDTPTVLADIAIVGKAGQRFFGHKCLLGAASQVLASTLSGQVVKTARTYNAQSLHDRFRRRHPIDELDLSDFCNESIERVLGFLYTGAMTAPSQAYSAVGDKLYRELSALAALFGVPDLSQAGRGLLLLPSFAIDAAQKLHQMLPSARGFPCDICLCAQSEQTLLCHQIVLTSRSPYFAASLSPTWRGNLGRCEGRLAVDLRHLACESVRMAVMWCYGHSVGSIVATTLGKVAASVEEYFGTLTEAIAVANELLLDQFKAEIEHALSVMVDVRTVIRLLEIGHKYEADQLKRVCLHFIAASLETCVEQRSFLTLSDELPVDLETTVKGLQHSKLPVTRSSLEQVTLRTLPPMVAEQPAVSPAKPKLSSRSSLPTLTSADVRGKSKAAAKTDDSLMFTMDEDTAQPSAGARRRRKSTLTDVSKAPQPIEPKAGASAGDGSSSNTKGGPVWGSVNNKPATAAVSLLDIQSQEEKRTLTTTATPKRSVAAHLAAPTTPIRVEPASPLTLPFAPSSSGAGSSAAPPTPPDSASKLSYSSIGKTAPPPSGSLLTQMLSGNSPGIICTQKQNLSQKERRRQQQQQRQEASKATSSPAVADGMAPASRKPAWGSVSAGSATGRPSLAQIQADEVASSHAQDHGGSVRARRISGVSKPEPVIAPVISPSASFASIQTQQVKEASSRARAVTKPLSRIQAEDRAIEDILGYYAATNGRGTGEWVTVAHRRN